MADKNEIEFRVKVTDDGLAPLASSLDKVDRKVDDLGASATTAGKQLDSMGAEARDAGNQAENLAGDAGAAGKQLGQMGKEAQDARAQTDGLGQSALTAGKRVAGVSKDAATASNGLQDLQKQILLIRNAFLALQGGGFLASLIKDVATTADGYNNLASRIKLATGEGEVFERSFERVQQIALDTNSALEGTGTLFSRLTDAGKSAGLSAQEAAGQALDLTESINQAVQLSGASAQASDAALTQLIQGLQGGVLRGEEFNSIMEQSPRLAKALADGLGVTTGQLREMSQEGRLSSEVVMNAIKSQADTLKTEFSTLPPTVGRAVQNLSTAWTVYVGEADKATGASKTAAQAINVLAENLDTVAGYLLDAGQAAAAFAALKLAQTFLAIGAAAKTSAVSIAANTTALTAANAAGAGAAAAAGKLVTILRGIRTFTLIGLVTNIKDIGTWLGEAAAKMAGYRDRSDEMAQSERDRASAAAEGQKVAEAQQAAIKAAFDAQFELSGAAQSSIAAFDDLVKSGKSAADAVAEIGKDFDLASQPGIVGAAAVLDKLQADGKISAAQFKQAWADALKGEDLVAFEVKARAALDGTARESERLAAIMDASLREAIRRSGADFDVLAGGMSKAAVSAINDTDTIIAGLDKLRDEGVDVGKALEASLSKGIKTADSQAAIEALKGRVEEVRKVLGDKVADGLLDQIEKQAIKAAGALSGLDSALKKLGITSDTELKKAAEETRKLYDEVVKTGGSAREQEQAFLKMANAAIGSGDQSSLAFAKSQAAARGFEITTDSAGKTIVRSLKDAASAAEKAAGSVGDIAAGLNQASAAAEKYLSYADRIAERNDAVGQLPPAGRKGHNGEELGEGVEEIGSGGQYRNRDGMTSDAKGNALSMGSDVATLTGIKNFLMGAGLNEEQAKKLALEFSDSKGDIPYFSNPGQMKYGGAGSTMSQALLKAAERTTFGTGGNGGAAVGGSTTHNVSISMGGRQRTVNTASPQDSEALVSMLKDLETAARRS